MVLRNGMTGRVVSIGGPDVREVIRAVKSSRASEADLNAAGIIAFVATNTGVVVPERLVDVAVRYWSSYPNEIDAWISDADAIEAEALAAWERQQDLLAP